MILLCMFGVNDFKMCVKLDCRLNSGYIGLIWFCCLWEEIKGNLSHECIVEGAGSMCVNLKHMNKNKEKKEVVVKLWDWVCWLFWVDGFLDFEVLNFRLFDDIDKFYEDNDSDEEEDEKM